MLRWLCFDALDLQSLCIVSVSMERFNDQAARLISQFQHWRRYYPCVNWKGLDVNQGWMWQCVMIRASLSRMHSGTNQNNHFNEASLQTTPQSIGGASWLPVWSSFILPNEMRVGWNPDMPQEFHDTSVQQNSHLKDDFKVEWRLQ